MPFQRKYRLLIFETLIVVPAVALFSPFLMEGASLGTPLMLAIYIFWILNIARVTTYFHEEVRGVATHPLLAGIVGEMIRQDFLPRLGTLPYAVAMSFRQYSRRVLQALQNPQVYARPLLSLEAYTSSLSLRVRTSIQPVAAYSLIMLGFASLF